MPTAAHHLIVPVEIPDKPPYIEADSVTLRQARDCGWVTGPGGKRLELGQLRDWCTRGCRVVAGGKLYLFPSVRAGRERLTTYAWCEAWNRWVGKVRAEDARHRVMVIEKAKEAARRAG